MQRQQPVSVRTIRREHHVNETDVPLPERDDTIETVEYSDGFGRLLQTRTQAEDVSFGDGSFGRRRSARGFVARRWETPSGDVAIPATRSRVLVSGWQIYDNKGRVVEKYEPFFSAGWDYAAAVRGTARPEGVDCLTIRAARSSARSTRMARSSGSCSACRMI